MKVFRAEEGEEAQRLLPLENSTNPGQRGPVLPDPALVQVRTSTSLALTKGPQPVPGPDGCRKESYYTWTSHPWHFPDPRVSGAGSLVIQVGLELWGWTYPGFAAIEGKRDIQ